MNNCIIVKGRKKITKKDIPSEIVGVVVGFAVFMGIALYCRE